jgi:putative DNA primase/helicase
MEKPKFIRPDLQGIPQEIIELPQFVCWQAAIRNDKWTKEPVNPHTGGLASVTDPESWGTVSEAWRHYQNNPDTVEGIGFVFAAGGGITGIDFDNCVNGSGDSIDSDVLRMVTELGSYAERSVSGTGAHVLCFGELPLGTRRRRPDFPKKGIGFECYDCGRFFTLTGAHFGGLPTYIRNAQEAVNRIHGQAFATETPRTPPPAAPGSVLDDEAILSKSRGSKQA